MYVSVVSSNTLHSPYRTTEHGPSKAYIVHDAGVMNLSVQGEGKQTDGLDAISVVHKSMRLPSADLGGDLSDVALTSETGRVRVSSWSVVHVVLSCHPGQVAR